MSRRLLITVQKVDVPPTFQNARLNTAEAATAAVERDVIAADEDNI